jgi:hypothetical protein
MFKTGLLCASVVFVCGVVSGGIDSKSIGYQLHLLLFDRFWGFHFIGCHVP